MNENEKLESDNDSQKSITNDVENLKNDIWEKVFSCLTEEILDLSKKFILIKSDPENKKELNEILDLAEEQLKEFTIEHFEKNGSKSILVYNTEKRAEKFKIILNGHLDVIPWKDYQYFPKIENWKLYGVWSMDMKSNVACLIKVFKNIAKKLDYPIWLQLVTDEEIWGFDWTKYQIEQWVRSDFIIAWETTNFDIVNKAKWGCWLKITSKWITAHWAYPWKWENAIIKMNNFLEILFNKYPIPREQEWITTVNLAKIETSNQTFNKIPDNCTSWLDIRFTPDKEKLILDEIKNIIPNDFDIEIIANESSLFVEENNYFLQKLKIITENINKKSSNFYWAQWSSDARHYTRIWCDWIEFWPIWWWIGTDEEWVDIKSLETFYIILEKFLIDLNEKRYY